MNRLSHYRFGKLESTNTIAIVTRKNIAGEKGLS